MFHMRLIFINFGSDFAHIFVIKIKYINICKFISDWNILVFKETNINSACLTHILSESMFETAKSKILNEF